MTIMGNIVSENSLHKTERIFPSEYQRPVMINSDYHVKYCVMSETALIRANLLNYPSKYQRLVLISGDYHVKYCVRKSLNKTKVFTLLNIKGLS